MDDDLDQLSPATRAWLAAQSPEAQAGFLRTNHEARRARRIATVVGVGVVLYLGLYVWQITHERDCNSLATFAEQEACSEQRYQELDR